MEGRVGAMSKQLLAVPALTAISLASLVGALWLVTDSPTFRGHAAGHWAMAVPVVFVALAIFRLPNARTRPRRIAFLFVAVLLATLAVAQLLEGIGAFSSGIAPVNRVLESTHVLGEGGTLLAIFTLPLALLAFTVVYLSAGIRALARR